MDYRHILSNMEIDLGSIIMSVIGVAIAIVLGGYFLVPIVVDVLGTEDLSAHPEWAAMIGVAVLMTFISIAIFPLMLMSQKSDGVIRLPSFKRDKWDD